MGFKKYLLFGLILVLGTGLYVYSLTNEYYSITVAGITLSLPIAVWVALPIAILYILKGFLWDLKNICCLGLF